MQHKMLELEIGLKVWPKTGLGIENKGFQFPQVLADITFLWYPLDKNIKSKLLIKTRY
jgi:hypothetical protein